MPKPRKFRSWRDEFRTLSKGSGASSRLPTASFGGPTNPSAADVQAKLNALGMASPPLATDGKLGQASVVAIKKFQASRGLTADGVPGPKTLAAMGFPGATGIGAAPGFFDTVSSAASSVASTIGGLKDSVVAIFPSFSTKFEGFTPYMYADSKGLVTTGIGNLIDPMSMALALPWKRPDGSLATPSEIQAAWQAVKGAYPGVQSTGSQTLTNIRLDKDGVAKLVTSKLDQNHKYLVGQYPRYPTWPADAQLALHSISWAWGPAFANVWGSHGQTFKSAANSSKPDFLTAASAMKDASVHEESINPGIVPRNAANAQLFQNAADVLDRGANPDLLYWPSNNVLKAVGLGIGGIIGLIALGFGGLAIYERYHS